jgi:hypothetical protein
MIACFDTYNKIFDNYLTNLSILERTEIREKNFKPLFALLALGIRAQEKITKIIMTNYAKKLTMLSLLNGITQHQRDFEDRKQKLSVENMARSAMILQRLLKVRATPEAYAG